MPELWDPFYVVDFAGIVLLIVGVAGFRRDSVPRRMGMLIAGYAWTAANFWRGLFGRVSEVAGGGVLDYGWAELCFTACILIAALAGLVWALVTEHHTVRGSSERVFLILSVCRVSEFPSRSRRLAFCHACEYLRARQRCDMRVAVMQERAES